MVDYYTGEDLSNFNLENSTVVEAGLEMSVSNTGQHRHSVVKPSVHYIGFCLLLQSCSQYLPTLENSVVKNFFCFFYSCLSIALSILNFPSLWPFPDTHSYYLHVNPSLQPCILVCLWMYYPLDFLSVIQYLGDRGEIIMWLGLLIGADPLTSENSTEYGHNLLQRSLTWIEHTQRARKAPLQDPTFWIWRCY